MSYYDDASLVVIPSGYKTSKVYAEKPTDGSGDLAFTRTGDTATRVNSAGLIEKVRTNLLLQSNTFNTTWSTSNASVTSGQAGYDGSSNAWLLSKSGAYGRVEQTLATTGLETFSVYVKAGTSNYTEITSNAGPYVGVNLTNGSIVAQSGVTALVVSVGSGWYRISIAYTKAASNIWRVIAGDAGSTSSAAGSAGTIVIQNAQAETGDIATPYIPTTTAAVSVGPVANVPRLDYLGSTCPRLLLEPQRTNLYTFSEQLNQWTASSATVTANYAVSPDGYTNAERVQFAAGGLLYNGGTGSAGENTLSVYAKATNGTSAKFRFFGNGNTTNSSDQTATGQWQRFTFTYTYSALTAGLKVATTGADDILFYGFQHEIGAQATSYIPTLAASATRGADACSKTGISSLIGQTEGTLFVEVQRLNVGVSAVALQFNDGTNNNRVQIEIGSGGQTLAICSSAGATTCLITGPTLTLGQTYKIAFSYKVNDFKLFVDGVSGGVDTSGAVPVSMSRLDLASEAGISYAGLALKQALHFKTALTSIQLAELTTL